jgi:septum formation protein
MLLRLQSRNHRVWTGCALLLDGEEHRWVSSATVSIGDLSDDVIEALILTGSWRGKAGGYDLAGPMAAHAELADGAAETVLGLAPELFKALLRSG